MLSRHDDLRDRIAQTYQEKGYVVKMEVPIGKKRVDIVAQNEMEVLIIEVVDTHIAH